MTQVPGAIWQEIAKRWSKLIKTQWGKKYFPMGGEDYELLEKLDELEEELENEGWSATAILAFTKVAPLLAEHEAISKMTAERPMLMAALPEILSVDEAVIIADMEYRLDKQEKADLKELLRTHYLMKE